MNLTFEEIRERNLKNFISSAYKIKLKRDPTLFELEQMKLILRSGAEIKDVINNLFVEVSESPKDESNTELTRSNDITLKKITNIHAKLSLETTSPLTQLFRLNNDKNFSP